MPFKSAPAESPNDSDLVPTRRNNTPVNKVRTLNVLYGSLGLICVFFLFFVDTINKNSLICYINVIRLAEMSIERFKSSFR